MHNMCMSTTIPPQEIRSLLKQHNVSQIDISYGLGITQGQVSRLLSGNFKKQNGTYKKLCIYVLEIIKKVQLPQVQENKDLMDAIANVWDGSPEQAKKLALVIRSLGPLCKKVV